MRISPTRAGALIAITAIALAGCANGAQTSGASKTYTTQDATDGKTAFKVVVNPNGGARLTVGVQSLKLIEEKDGEYTYAFKDMNGNGKLDVFEDWRKSAEERAADLAPQLSKEQQAGLMLFFKAMFRHTGLVHVNFQMFQVGSQVGGAPYYIFDYAAGPLRHGGGGGLGYFLAVEITLLIAQVINFFAQRSITFKSNSSMGRAAFWYAVAYMVITFVAGAAQGFYKAPIYAFFIELMGAHGETTADVITMVVNSAISFWVFFPIFKVIFKQEEKAVAA